MHWQYFWSSKIVDNSSRRGFCRMSLRKKFVSRHCCSISFASDPQSVIVQYNEVSYSERGSIMRCQFPRGYSLDVGNDLFKKNLPCLTTSFATTITATYNSTPYAHISITKPNQLYLLLYVSLSEKSHCFAYKS